MNYGNSRVADSNTVFRHDHTLLWSCPTASYLRLHPGRSLGQQHTMTRTVSQRNLVLARNAPDALGPLPFWLALELASNLDPITCAATVYRTTMPVKPAPVAAAYLAHRHAYSERLRLAASAGVRAMCGVGLAHTSTTSDAHRRALASSPSCAAPADSCISPGSISVCSSALSCAACTHAHTRLPATTQRHAELHLSLIHI